jgi:hypothetical protein
MDRLARWISLDPEGVSGVVAVCRGFARTLGESGAPRAPRSAPICLWGRAAEPVRLDDELWAGPGEFVFALLVPRRLAPGRADRWLAWGLSPVVAALRRFGAHAYLDGNGVCLHGSRIGGGVAREIDGCAAILGTFPAEPPPRFDERGERGALLEFDPWLAALNREGRARQILAAFRSALEVQHGWQFDTGWPSEAELSAIASEVTL